AALVAGATLGAALDARLGGDALAVPAAVALTAAGVAAARAVVARAVVAKAAVAKAAVGRARRQR
ncbi:MAG: hypothetical protein JWP04_2063, partial [Belnapia sp.]|nr:hypothetical protein [Belnapia sp.]